MSIIPRFTLTWSDNICYSTFMSKIDLFRKYFYFIEILKSTHSRKLFPLGTVT